MSKRVNMLLVIWATAISGGAFWAQQYALDRYDLNLAIPEWLWVQLAAGWVFLLAGLATASSPERRRMGIWMIALALIWMIRLIFTPPLIQWETIGMALAFYGVLFIILYIYPDGALNRVERRVAGVYLAVVAAVAYIDVALEDYYGWVEEDHPTCCPSHLLLIEEAPDVRRTILSWASVATALVLVALTIRFLARWKRSTTVGRRGMSNLGLLLPIMVLLVVVPGASALASGFTEDSFADTASSRLALYVQNGALMVVAGIIVMSLVVARMSRARVADLMEVIDEPMSPAILEQRIRDALGDQSAVLGFRFEDEHRYVGTDGHELGELEPDSDSVTDLDGEVVLIHDAAVDRRLVRSVGSAAHLALENARLQAQLKAQLQEVVTSRRRLVNATDEARRAVERDLHDGAQQRLVTLAATLEEAQRSAGGSDPELEKLLADASEEAGLAIEDLRSLARGVHPAILNQAGLAPAVDALGDRSMIPVITRITDRRFGTEVETTAYYVIAEALTNANKHSAARQVKIEVEADDEVLTIEISDDGSGGANDEGSGIRGLIDRVEAIGGTMVLSTGPGEGTKVTARIPIDPAGDR